ncbi:MAG: DUF1801 domain-containing protein [Pirellulales bacterium]
MPKHEQANGDAASRLIDQRIQELTDWRGETLARMRKLILASSSDIVEEVKWMGTPVWSCDGILCTGETYKQVVKLTFACGASLPDPSGLFNSSLDGNKRRAIDIREDETVNARAFQSLINAAIAYNKASKQGKAKPKRSTKRTVAQDSVEGELKAAPKKGVAPPERVVLLSGGNPQIAKGDGDAPVQAYIAAMPGWKSDLGQRLDALIVRTVPKVCKAVKWNSPFYGLEGRGWFLSFHVFSKYVKVTFFKGAELDPSPPGATERSGASRWLDIYERDELDEKQLVRWIKQAAKLPGWNP